MNKQTEKVNLSIGGDGKNGGGKRTAAGAAGDDKPEPRRAHKLESIQSHHLYKHLEVDQVKLETGRESWEALAAHYTKVCGFEVTAANVRSSVKGLGFFHRPSRVYTGGGRYSGSLKLRTAQRRIRRLEYTLTALIGELGATTKFEPLLYGDENEVSDE